MGRMNKGTYQLSELLTAWKEFDGDPITLNDINDPSLSITS